MKGIVDGIRNTEEPLGTIDAHDRQYAKGLAEGRRIAVELNLPRLPVGQARQLVDLSDLHAGIPPAYRGRRR